MIRFRAARDWCNLHVICAARNAEQPGQRPARLTKAHNANLEALVGPSGFVVGTRDPWSPTAGNLVFQGTALGQFNPYEVRSGARLWSAPTQAVIVAAPMTYQVDSEHEQSVGHESKNSD